MDELSISVGAKKYTGWQTIRVTRSIEQLADSFSIGYNERYNESSAPLPINEGDPCVIRLGNDGVLTGYIDVSNLSYTHNSHQAGVTGRSATGDLVDCAAIHRGGAWKDTTIDIIVKNLCAPFGVSVSGGRGRKAFRRFKIQEGETVFEAIDRAAKMRGLLAVSDASGGLTLTTFGSTKTRTPLQRGTNILSGSRQGSMRDRFSDYIVKAQIPGSDTKSGKDVTITRTASDSRVKRHRPMIIVTSDDDTGREVADFAKWTRNRRAGEARRVTYTVQGWRDNTGNLWSPNTLIDVDDPVLRVKTELLITGVTYARSNEGTTTQIDLARKEAFAVGNLPPPKISAFGNDFFA